METQQLTESAAPLAVTEPATSLPDTEQQLEAAQLLKESSPVSQDSLSGEVDEDLNSADSEDLDAEAVQEDSSASAELAGAVGGESQEALSKTSANENQAAKKSTAPAAKSAEPAPKSGKSKKKEDKSIDHILRALSSLQTTEEKLAALCKKYADLHEEHRGLQLNSKQVQRKLTVVIREKEQLQSEHTKAVMARSKLEGLCRELQKHNRMIKEESLARAKEEDEKRREISTRFQTTIEDIQKQMNENHERNNKLREENTDLAGKLKKFIDEYELREQAIEKLKKHQELQQQLADAKLAQADAKLEQEQERGKKEKEVLFLQLSEAHKKVTALEGQLGLYKDRYEEFQSTINRSNEMFQRFKTDMDKMGKRMKKLEKDAASWKSKWESSNKSLLEMAEEKAQYAQERLVFVNKIGKLESLCRALQGELRGKKPSDPSSDATEVAGSTEVPSTATPPNTPERTANSSPDPSSQTPQVPDTDAPSSTTTTATTDPPQPSPPSTTNSESPEEGVKGEVTPSSLQGAALAEAEEEEEEAPDGSAPPTQDNIPFADGDQAQEPAPSATDALQPGAAQETPDEDATAPR